MSLADLLNQATSGPWDWFGGYPQRVTNPAATLVAEVFDDPDTPASTVRLIALAPDMARLLIDMADAVALARGYIPSSEQFGALDIYALLARFAALDAKAGGQT